MNKKIYITGISLALLSLASCSDFLDREPLDFGSEVAYYLNENDLKMATNEFYDNILPKNETWFGGIFNEDNSSDNQIGSQPDALFYEGEKRTVEQSSSEWNFDNLRGINYFIGRVISQRNGDGITGSEEYINHYLGEGYFFRAWEHFRLLRNFGDVPILTTMLSDDATGLAEATRRQPRNEVARFIIRDLEIADSLMLETAPETGRLCKDAAMMLMARVALYEGTWEKYHAGTAFVPGNSKWVGHDMYPDFTFKAGSAEAEVNYFLQVAVDASKTLLDRRGTTLDSDYLSMFNNTGVFPDNDEVILARYYLSGVLYHSVGQYLGRTGAGTGLTRALVNSFLMADGLPIYASSATMPYGGDADMVAELTNRDGRLAVNAAARNIVEVPNPETGAIERDTIAYFVPHLTNSGNERSTTGYEMYKWVSYEGNQQESGQGTTANPIFRSAEAMLTYLEAYYELHGSLDGNCDTYWRLLRRRAGVDEDYNKTIAATDLSQENDLATMSKGQLVSATLYNIRRERRCEFYAEGMRLDDLKRWRALDQMRNYQVEGMNLWNDGNADCMANIVWPNGSGGTTLEVGTNVSAPGLSTYMRPLQVMTTLVTYNTGYNFPKPHYLEPIPIAEFLLATIDGVTTLYQNPGWPTNSDGIADYSYDCD